MTITSLVLFSKNRCDASTPAQEFKLEQVATTQEDNHGGIVDMFIVREFFGQKVLGKLYGYDDGSFRLKLESGRIRLTFTPDRCSKVRNVSGTTIQIDQ